jgi:DNA polymerase IIIc chi subunit
MVEGKFNDGTFVRCPLLFFPVTLTITNQHWILHPRKEAGITFNKSFLIAYSYYNKVKANEALLEEDFEEADEDSILFRTWLYKLLRTQELEVHFNPDTYRDELTLFPSIKKDEFEGNHKAGELKLMSHAILGIFPQAGSNLVPDYRQLIEDSSFQDLEEFFNLRTATQTQPLTHNFHSLVKEEKIYSLFPMDVWQENALKAVKLGHSMVIQGPPGTGKSQLICNIISDSLASGKRVLVVCQKRVALDVVYNRLKTHQLGNYLALVHDFKTDRKEIYEKAAIQIEKVDEYKSKNLSLDAIQLERKFLQICHRADQIIEELEAFKTNLFDESECGTSIKELYLQSDPTLPVINLKQEFQHFKFDTLSERLRKLKNYFHYAQKLEADDYEWKERKSFSIFNQSDLQLILQAINDTDHFYKSLAIALKQHYGNSLDYEQCELYLEYEQEAKDIKELLKNEKVYSYFLKMVPEDDDETSSLWLSNVEKNIMSCFEGEGPESSTPGAQLGTLQKALYRSMKARSSLIGLIRWELFSKDKFTVKRVLVANGLNSNKAGFKTLERMLDTRLNFEHHLTKLREKEWLLELPESISKKDFIHWFAYQQFALNAKLNYGRLRGIRNFIEPSRYNLDQFIERLETLFNLLTPLNDHKPLWLNYLTNAQIQSISNSPEEAEILIKILKRDFSSLCYFDAIEEGLDSDEKSIISKLHEKVEFWDTEKLVSLFMNSLSLSWIDHLEAKHPELRIVSSGQIHLLENELQDLTIEKQNLSEEIVLLRAREKVVDELKFNRLNNRVTYRDLLHQVTKKKKIWPIRKVVAEYEEEVFKLIPCWLTSPESASAIFPMKDLFDIVIFDEASQCFAEQGIPAFYRGKQVIVAGDSMQLQPGDFYQARWDEEDFDHPDSEVDSLLELTGRYLMNIQLRGHYRSKTPELIAFSNEYFYKNKLQFLPDRLILNRNEPALVYEKLNGLWENNTNREEAQHVASLVLNLSKENPTKEIGIVTFNAPQQFLIMDLIEETFQLNEQSIPEHLFVKNIENVQGDERDIIIFSVGYAPDKDGKVVARFGSLNIAGGENRLNVAVSRAKEKIILVTSLFPHQLNVEETLNKGPKLLKAYLEFVYKNSINVDVKNNLTLNEDHVYLTVKIKEWAKGKWPEITLDQNELPFSDFILKKEERHLSALFTDDNRYYQSLSTKSDHALIPHLLSMKNWPYLRVYSRNLWSDPENFYLEISKFINQADQSR